MLRFAHLSLLLATTLPWVGGSLVSAADPAFTFERDARPILKTHCFHCHGEGDGDPEGGLDLRLRRWLVAGGESGAAIEPGNPDDSLLIERIESGEMPPEDVQHRLSNSEVARLQRWIAGGAKTARPEPKKLPAFWLTEEERGFWSFQPVRRPALPPVQHVQRVRTAVDRFVLARLEREQLEFAVDADRATLIRRVTLDLTGLPPAPEVVDAFVADPAPDAYERLVDRLLASPHYGERWGRHWLDAAGYADSEGYNDDDVERRDAYRYRDYVIRSLNAGKPVDQFVREQLAGDEMVRPPYGELAPDDLDKLIATGFLRMAPDGSASAADKEVARNRTIADTLQTVSTAVLGLTLHCAQCHNHRYDPIPQVDYYRFRALFEPALDWKKWRTPAERRVSLYTAADRAAAAKIEAEAKQIEKQRSAKQAEYIERTFEKELAKLAPQLREPIRAARSTSDKKRTAEQKKLLKDHPSVNVTAGSLYLYDKKAADDLKAFADRAAKMRSTKPKQRFVRSLTEPAGGKPPQTFLFSRGDHQQPRQSVEPGELLVLDGDQRFQVSKAADVPSTGRRLAYARWLTRGDHPLVARVWANRLWTHHFGRGIVATPGDFGALGGRPTHPELLDWLADELVRGGWELKTLHRAILLSTTYRQAALRNTAGERHDGANLLYWRRPVRRLEAEVVRDCALAISGQLNTKAGDAPVPVMADRVGQIVIGKENLNAGRPGPVIPMQGEQFRRSIYIQVRRSRPLSILETFDLPAMTPNCTKRSHSTVATQSLLMMNGPQMLELAGHFARRLEREAGSKPADRVALGWRLVYGRAASSDETEAAIQFVSDQKASFKSDQERQAWTSLCHALLSSNEFLYVD